MLVLAMQFSKVEGRAIVFASGRCFRKRFWSTTQQNGPGAIAAVSKKVTPEGAPSQQSSESTMLGDSGVPECGYRPKPVAEISGVEY